MALVQELAETTKVPAEVSWVVDLQSQGAELVLECRHNLSKGNAVIVRGSQAALSPPPPQDMDAEYLEGLGYDVDNVIYEVHGEYSPCDFFTSGLISSDAARRRWRFGEPYIKRTLREFVSGIKDHERVQAILSAPSPRFNLPELIQLSTSRWP